ncbi:MAG TPA: endo-1,4-beta-xylanase [Pelagibacterium sp.]|uniref:endo-1,4-beta-xylanase n=1 Tax=Pelagibacterium sp. TaxID=1967288 RepID=UPI002BFAE51A|nr:endo-1,4-beta-xylanase [Pelagibacterium sp.]HWJ87737.1 endo-1,4-beta-xylanase [Pelagibacterium sp.]
MGPTRRDVLAMGLATCGWAAAGGTAASAQPAHRPVPFGGAVYLPDLEADPRLGDAIVAHCQAVTPVNELKWISTRPAPDLFDFAASDKIADFARTNALAMHGHTLVWYAELPEWVTRLTSAADAERALTEHIVTTMQRYGDVARSWDVVNEPIPDAARRPTDRRDSHWRALLGDDHIAQAFRIAHDVDPDALLVINEYDVEFATGYFPAKRQAFAHLIRELVDKGVPVHAVGLQGHLRGGVPIAKDELAQFVADMRELGLKIMVTELDVIDRDLPGPADVRDAIIAAQVEDFLGAITASGPLHSITTWGLSDTYTWIRWAYGRSDGLGNRPLPLDENFQRKPMFDVIDRFRSIV